MKPLPIFPFVALAAIVVSNAAAAKCFKVLAAKDSVIYECKSSPNSFPGVIRDTVQLRFQGATVFSTEDEKCPAKAPACEDEKAAESAAELHRTGIRRHDGNVADSQNACSDKLNSPTVCGRSTARPRQTDMTIVTTQPDQEGSPRRIRYYGRNTRPPEAR